MVTEMLILWLRLSLSQQTAGKPALSAGGAQADNQTWCSTPKTAMPWNDIGQRMLDVGVFV
jgi:hypothetical protein